MHIPKSYVFDLNVDLFVFKISLSWFTSYATGCLWYYHYHYRRLLYNDGVHSVPESKLGCLFRGAWISLDSAIVSASTNNVQSSPFHHTTFIYVWCVRMSGFSSVLSRSKRFFESSRIHDSTRVTLVHTPRNILDLQYNRFILVWHIFNRLQIN